MSRANKGSNGWIAKYLVGLATVLAIVLAVWLMWPHPAVDPATPPQSAATQQAPAAATKVQVSQPFTAPDRRLPDAVNLQLPPVLLPPLAVPAQNTAAAIDATTEIAALPVGSAIQANGTIGISDSRVAQGIVWSRLAGCWQPGQSLSLRFGIAGGRGASGLFEPQWQGTGGPEVATCVSRALQGLRLPVATDSQGTLTLQFGPQAAVDADWRPLH